MGQDNKLLRLSPQAGKVPTVNAVRDGRQPVYFTFDQGADFSEPPVYHPPTEWPVLHTLLRRPQCLRLLTHPDQTITDPTNGTERIRTFPINPLYSAVLQTQVVSFCSCQASVNFNGHETSPDGLTPEFITQVVLGANASNFPGAYSSFSDNVTGTCVCDPGTPQPIGKARDYRDAAANLSLPSLVGRMIDSTLPDNFLSPASVAAEHVPASVTDYPFIGGEVLNVWVFGLNNGEDQYDPMTVTASAVGDRLVKAFRLFKKFQLWLCVDSTVEVSNSMSQKLEDIADALADYGVRYLNLAGDAAANLSGLTNGFFGET